MTEISKKEKQIEWACRVLITLEVFVIIAGYIAYFQTKYQLVSPLIPHSILYEITDTYMKASLIASAGFLAGLWFYSFKKKTIALILFILSVLSYEIFLLLFRK